MQIYPLYKQYGAGAPALHGASQEELSGDVPSFLYWPDCTPALPYACWRMLRGARRAALAGAARGGRTTHAGEAWWSPGRITEDECVVVIRRMNALPGCYVEGCHKASRSGSSAAAHCGRARVRSVFTGQVLHAMAEPFAAFFCARAPLYLFSLR